MNAPAPGPSRTTTTPMAWCLCVLSVALWALSVTLQVATASTPVTGVFGSRGGTGVVGMAFSFLGVLLATRRSLNPIGWIFLAAGLLASLQRASLEYAVYGLIARRASLVGEEFAAWMSNWMWVPLVGLVGVFVIHLFPNGTFLSPRWRMVGWISAVGMTLTTFAEATTPGPMQSGAGIVNPFGIEEAHRLVAVMIVAYGFGFLGSIAAALTSLVVRFRRAGGIERAQIKWIAYAAGLLAAALAAGSMVFPTSAPDSLAYRVFANLTVFFLGGLPVAMAIAILRYRLYDIDRLINRTLVYGVVTVLLALGYAGGVLLAQAVLPVPNDSPAVVAITTLAVVALFRPLRNRVQGFVDRRFYRRRYDAARTIESFGSRLRQETDLDSLRGELLGLVKDTMQPAHASLWLRSGLER